MSVCYEEAHLKDSDVLMCWGMILLHVSTIKAHCRLPNCDTLHGASEHPGLRLTVLLHHFDASPESHAVDIRVDALLVPLVPGVVLSLHSGNGGSLWVACCPAQVRLLKFSLERKVLIGALLQNFESGSQAQPLFLLCPASTRRYLHSNRE